MNFLPNDTARCAGAKIDGELWEECETCLRRTAPQPEIVTWIAPPPIVVFECENLIEPEE
jgi:hypothetical protein